MGVNKPVHQGTEDSRKLGIGRYWHLFADGVVGIVVGRPCACFCTCFGLMLATAALSVVLGMMTIEDADDAWTLWDTEYSEGWKALDFAQDRVDRMQGTDSERRLRMDLLQHGASMSSDLHTGTGRSRRPNRRSSARSPVSSLGSWFRKRTTRSSSLLSQSRRLQPDFGDDDGLETLYLYYKVDGAASVFNPGSLLAICNLEQHLLAQLSEEELSTLSWTSPVRLFYGSASTEEPDDRQLQFPLECPELSDSSIKATVEAMHADIQKSFSASVYAGYVHPDFPGSMNSPLTSTIIEGPAHVLKDLTEDTRKKLGMEYGFLKSAFEGDDDQFINFGHGTRIRVNYTDLDDIGEMMTTDFMLAIVSFIFVFCIMYGYVGSLFMASFSMLQILLSLPIAGLIYRGIFQIDYFESVHILIVYLVLGIGADDIFVFVDTYKNIDAEMNGKQSCTTREDLRKVMKATYMRSATAIFNTSFTTAVAFLASSGSKIMPMRTCGWFAGISILVNFLFAVTFTPAAVAVWQSRFRKKRCCSCDWSLTLTEEPKEEESTTGSPGGSSMQANADALESQAHPQQGTEKHDKEIEEKPLNLFDRVIARTYLPFMSTSFQVGCFTIRPGSLFVVLTMIGVAVQGAIFTMQLTPPTKVDQWYPDNHMQVDFSKFTAEVSYRPDHENSAIVGVFWGIQGLDTSDLDVYKPDDWEGKPIFDGSFDLSNPDAQNIVLETCEKLRNLICTEEGCKNGAYERRTLMMQSNDKTSACFLEEFRDYIVWRDGNNAWPLARERFNEELMLFRINASAGIDRSGCCEYGNALDKDYFKDIGFIGGQLKYVQIRIRSTMLWDTPYDEGIDVRDMVEDWLNSEVRRDAPGMGSVKVHSQGVFAEFDFAEELLRGLFQGISIAAPVAFFVLLASTWNIIVSVYAVVCVGSVVLSVLGFCKSAMGWDLGTGEAIAGVIVLGYSIDFVVHLSHIYSEGGYHEGLYSRNDRAIFAIKNMGSTVFAGAITTAGSSVVMFFCFIRFFPKMATLISVTIMYSFLFSLGLLMGLLWTVGPQGNVGDVSYLCHLCASLRGSSSKSSKPSAADDSSDAPSPGGSAEAGETGSNPSATAPPPGGVGESLPSVAEHPAMVPATAAA